MDFPLSALTTGGYQIHRVSVPGSTENLSYAVAPVLRVVVARQRASPIFFQLWISQKVL